MRAIVREHSDHNTKSIGGGNSTVHTNIPYTKIKIKTFRTAMHWQWSEISGVLVFCLRYIPCVSPASLCILKAAAAARLMLPMTQVPKLHDACSCMMSIGKCVHAQLRTLRYLIACAVQCGTRTCMHGAVSVIDVNRRSDSSTLGRVGVLYAIPCHAMRICVPHACLVPSAHPVRT